MKVVKAKNQNSQGRRACHAHAWEKDNIAQLLSPLFRTTWSQLLDWLSFSLKTPSTGARFESKAKSRYRAANINIIYICWILFFSFIHPYINEDDTLKRYRSSTPISFHSTSTYTQFFRWNHLKPTKCYLEFEIFIEIIGQFGCSS